MDRAKQDGGDRAGADRRAAARRCGGRVGAQCALRLGLDQAAEDPFFLQRRHQPEIQPQQRDRQVRQPDPARGVSLWRADVRRRSCYCPLSQHLGAQLDCPDHAYRLVLLGPWARSNVRRWAVSASCGGHQPGGIHGSRRCSVGCCIDNHIPRIPSPSQIACTHFITTCGPTRRSTGRTFRRAG